MPEAFDPYYRWLGIAPDEQPADHYRLLGVERFENNPEVIEAAADRQSVHLRTFQIGPQAELSERLLAEVAAARACLLNLPKKTAYDTCLRQQAAQSAASATNALWDSLPVEPESDAPHQLAPIRRRKNVRSWVIGGSIAALLVFVVIALISVVAWSVGRIQSAVHHATQHMGESTTSSEPARLKVPDELPSPAEPSLTGSAKKSPRPPLLFTFFGPTRPVTAVVFSPDGRTLAVGAKDGTVRLWSTDSGAMIWAAYEHQQEVNCLALSPDGETLASAGDDGLILLWDAAKPAVRQKLTGHKRGIRAISFSPDGKHLASAGHNRTIRIWDVATGQIVKQWPAHDDSIMTLSYSPDGKMLASAGLDQSIRLWDPATGQRLHTLTGHSAAVRSLAFAPDGLTLVAGDEAGRWILWDTSTGQSVKEKKAHQDPILAVAFSSDGHTFATAGRDTDQGIRLWTIGDDEPIATLPGHAKAISTIIFSPDGRTLATGSYDHTVRLWQVPVQ